jgi:hypothetical protein
MNGQKLLTDSQRRMLAKFYNLPPVKVKLTKPERDQIWNDFKKQKSLSKFKYLNDLVPAIYSQLSRAITNNKKIQPAVFSECVYSQAIADKYQLSIFESYLDHQIKKYELKNQNFGEISELVVRYLYQSTDGQRVLVQAGGGGAIDCAFISYEDNYLTKIELKEPYARTSTPDLPKYSEDGFLVSSEKFEKKHPQYKSMIEEQIRSELNIFKHIGSNVSNFSAESIASAISGSYKENKFADFYCTEDAEGFVIILPVTDVHKWATLEGELRPAGRNSYKVWTPKKLIQTLESMDAEIIGQIVRVHMSKLEPRKARGGENISGLKITPLFWVKIKNISYDGEFCIFNLNSVMQHISDVTAKIKFGNLSYQQIRNHYLGSV